MTNSKLKDNEPSKSKNLIFAINLLFFHVVLLIVLNIGKTCKNVKNEFF